VVHGAAWLVVKLESEARIDAKLSLARAWLLLVILGVCWLLLLFITLPGAAGNPWLWLIALLMAADLVVLRVVAGRDAEKLPFALSAAFFGLFWLMQGASQYPVMVRASNNPGLSLQAGNAGGSPATMAFLGVLAPIVLLVVLGYTVFVYRIFKGKVKHAQPEKY
jgi:cytochrome d ubiquinol oxidase subunit II